MFKTVLSGIVAIAFAGSAHAATIYEETFDGQNGKGAIGTSVDTSGVSWSIDLGDAALFNSDDVFGVQGNEFTIRDTNAGCTNSGSGCGGAGVNFADLTLPMWLSPLIDVSGFNNLMLSMDVDFADTNFEAGGGLNSQDTFDISALLDGTESVLTSAIQVSGAQADIAFSASLVAASTVQIKVTGNTYAGTEIIAFDNVLLTGDPLAAVPLPASGLMLLAGLGAMALRRRKT